MPQAKSNCDCEPPKEQLTLLIDPIEGTIKFVRLGCQTICGELLNPMVGELRISLCHQLSKVAQKNMTQQLEGAWLAVSPPIGTC
ncbi:MAG: hypothetical protein V1936_02420 [Patescibacteria group bacterium]